MLRLESTRFIHPPGKGLPVRPEDTRIYVPLTCVSGQGLEPGIWFICG